MGYKILGSITGRSKRSFCTQKCPDDLGPTHPLANGHRDFFFQGYSGRGVQTHCSPSTNVKVKKLSRIVPLLHLQPLSRALCQCNSVNFRMTDLSTPWPSVPPPPITARCKFVIFTLRPLWIRLWYWSIKILIGSGFPNYVSVLHPGQGPWPGVVGQEILSWHILFSMTPVQAVRLFNL